MKQIPAKQAQIVKTEYNDDDAADQIHDPLIPGGIGGSALKVDAVARNLMQTRQTIANIISRHTGKSLEDVLAKTASDSYFDAEQAVEWGLADRIIHEL